MSYTALYRKFRPAFFDEVKGQKHVIDTLKNQIKYDRLSHAYVFCGTRGTGKTSVAKILAKAVNCEHPENGNPCGSCSMCSAIAAGTSTNVIEIDAASNNGVDNVRDIIDEVAYRPTQGKYKVYIIDEVHMLSTGAFNALLKTLEEPPAYVIFILATTEAAKIPLTILSRCQRYDFHRIDTDTIAARMEELLLAEGRQVEEKGIRYIARLADGAMRDGLSLLDQCLAGHDEGLLTFEEILTTLGTADTESFERLLMTVKSGDVAKGMNVIADIAESGKELSAFVSDFVWYLRDMLLAKSAADIRDIPDMSVEDFDRLCALSKDFGEDTLMYYIQVMSALLSEMRSTANKRISLEMAVVSLMRPQMNTGEAAFAERVRLLEEKLEKGIIPMQGSAVREKETAEKPKEKPAPVKAAGPALLEIAANWKQIVESLSEHAITRNALRAAKPSYDGRDGTDFLYIETENSSAGGFLELHKEDIKKAIADATGYDAKVRIVMKNGKESEKLYGLPIEERVKSITGMPVEIEN